jgi:hypothetical protein
MRKEVVVTYFEAYMSGGTLKTRKKKTLSIIRVPVDSAPGPLHRVNVANDDVSEVHAASTFKVEMSWVNQANSGSRQGNIIKTTNFRVTECARCNGPAETLNHSG